MLELTKFGNPNSSLGGNPHTYHPCALPCAVHALRALCRALLALRALRALCSALCRALPVPRRFVPIVPCAAQVYALHVLCIQKKGGAFAPPLVMPLLAVN